MQMRSLEELAKVDIRSINKDSLIDINDISIDTNKDRQERLIEYIRQIKNPYCFKCNGIVVKMRFSSNEETLEEKLNDYFLSQ